MKRVKAIKIVGVRQSLLMAGLALATVNVQASVTITDGSFGGIILTSPNPVILPPITSLNTASASTNVSGSMNYSLGTSSGYFNENDSSPNGSTVVLDLNRKGYGYHTEASAEVTQLKARAETNWVSNSDGNIYSYNYGNSSANATSSWNDWFVITGGTGLGTASLSSVLKGKLTSSINGSAGYSLNIGYSTGAYCYYWYNTCSAADQNQTLFNQTSSLSGKSKSTLSQDVEGEFTFAYGTPFQLTATLNASASNGGTADFTLTSLGNSLVLPEGGSLLSSSGSFVQAVPEANTYAMMLVGLGLVGLTVMRRRVISK